jgi:uncharacterized membrane protein YfcA
MFHDLIYFLVGIVVGSMNAVAGGGMLVGFPIMVALGFAPLIINATGNVATLPGALGSIFGYRRFLKKVPKTYLLLLIPAVIGSAIGATLLRHTSFANFNHYIPALLLFAVLLFALQPWLHNQLHQHLHGSKKQSKSTKPLIIVAIAILPLSIYGGYFGVGLGFILLAFLGFTKLHEHIHRMNALKNTLVACISVVTIVCLYSTHLINWHLGLIMGSGNLIGGYSTAVGIQKVPPHAIRIIVIVIGICAATYLTLHSY